MAKQPRGYRTADSYLSRDPANRQKQLNNLKRRHRTKPIASDALAVIKPPDKYADDPIGFIEGYFYVIEGRKLIWLLDFERELLGDLFLWKASEVRPNLAVIGQPKKTGKSTFAAAIALWFLCTKPMSETYLLASDVAQSELVCFDKLCKSIRMNPILRKKCKIKPGKGRIEYEDSAVQILAPNSSLAGINPSLIVAEELWSWTTTEHKRAWDELTNIPTREENLNLVTSYAGYTEDEDSILWTLYKQGLDQAEGKEEKDPRFLFRWFDEKLYEQVPWVKPSYLPQQKKRLRENSFLRLHYNQWTSGFEAFVDDETINTCINPDLRRGADFDGEVILGVDIGIKSDCSAVAVVGKIEDSLVLIDHALFKPPKGGVLNLERTVEDYISLLNKKYKIRELRYDPFQFERSAQKLRKASIRAIEYPQTANNCVEMTDCLQGLLKSANLMLYDSDEVRAHLLHCKVKEMPNRGWRIIKSSQSQKIDLAVAIALAVTGGQQRLLHGVKAGLIIIDNPDDDDDDGMMWHDTGWW